MMNETLAFLAQHGLRIDKNPDPGFAHVWPVRMRCDTGHEAACDADAVEMHLIAMEHAIRNGIAAYAEHVNVSKGAPGISVNP